MVHWVGECPAQKGYREDLIKEVTAEQHLKEG